ncbi:MAG: 2-amino-4-hydroxy-6-hydroxymethyldihydropteridine diphosphokinase [Chloroflexi bacterium]|nr:2-amino-4-hydroxy-6-hydroxymethyldihydropteridine diphosphokinase [Chloroflexota bacterium]
MHKVYLSLGSNLGDKVSNLSRAISNLKESNITIDRWNSNDQESIGISSIYETEHWSEDLNQKDYPNYFNIACRVITSNGPIDLLNEIKIIEKKLGRNLEKEKNSPREIDIDILFFDQVIVDQKNLIIPHPRLSLRAFVLKPLSEIAPDYIHPIDKCSVTELFEKLTNIEKNSVKKINYSINEN